MNNPGKPFNIHWFIIANIKNKKRSQMFTYYFSKIINKIFVHCFIIRDAQLRKFSLLKRFVKNK